MGIELRGLLSSVDTLIPTLPLWSHREIEMAHKVLSKDMAGLVQSMKLAQEYSRTTVESEYRKGMLQSAHVLVMDAKNLLDSVDSVRLRIINNSSNENFCASPTRHSINLGDHCSGNNSPNSPNSQSC